MEIYPFLYSINPRPFLYSINPRIVWPGALVVLFMVGAATITQVVTLNPDSRSLQIVKSCGFVIILVIVAAQIAIAGSYLFYPGYLDHAEVINTAVSWLGWEGYPLYPSLDTGDVYGVPYGPLLYQAHGLLLYILGPSIEDSKILGLVAFVASPILSFFVLRRRGATVAEALAITSVQCTVQADFNNQAIVFGVRADPLLFIFAQTAILVATSVPSVLGSAALGLLGGISAGLKIHGMLYIFPAFIYFLFRADPLSVRIRLMVVAGVAGILVLAAPFLTNNASIVEYTSYLRILSGQHPWERWLFEKNIVFATMGVIPLVWIYACFTPTLPRAVWWFVTSIVISIAIVSYIASFAGAGPYHLLPFLPSLAWAFFVICHEASSRLRDSRSRGVYEGISLGLIFALLLGYGPFVIVSWGRTLNTFANAALLHEGIAEIDKALDDHPEQKIAVGPGVEPAYQLRVIPVFRGNPLPLDSSAWMNFKAQGISDQVVRRAIRECRVDLWLLPSGPLFATTSFYDGRNLYSAEVLADFRATFVKQASGQIFDQWECKRLH